MRFGPEYFKAADLIDQAYKGQLVYDHSLDHKGVQAYITNEGWLILPGTNEPWDWVRFNFKVGNGETQKWHEGFLNYAQAVWNWLKSENITVTLITGHSLGAAAAQILAYSMKDVPAIALASPKVLAPGAVAYAENLVVVVRDDDFVTMVPKKFSHVAGELKELTPDEPHSGEDHRIDNYVSIMREANLKG